MIVKCKVCGGPVRTVPSRPRIFCSTKCWSDYKTSSPLVIKRFWAKVEIRGPDDCWLWKPTAKRGVHGILTIGRGKNIGAHRLSMQISLGRELAAEEHVLHKCDNPPCVNPNHLWIGTEQDNKTDMVQKGRSAKGSRVGSSKLVESQVREIKRRYQRYVRGKNNSVQLGKEFGVGSGTIRDIATNQSWTHVEK